MACAALRWYFKLVPVVDGARSALRVAQHQQEVSILVIDVLDALLAKAAVTLSFRLDVDVVQVANFLVCHNERD